MAKVSLESSNVLNNLTRLIAEVNNNMQDNLEMLDAAFSTACESWQDKNAQTCGKALEEHSAAMQAAFRKLDRIENSVGRLGVLASEYEDL